MGYTYTKSGEYFEVNSLHLPIKSEMRITAICEMCGKERSLQRCKYNPICLSCILIDRNKNLSPEHKKKLQEMAQARNKRMWSSDPEYAEFRKKQIKRLENQKGIFHPRHNPDPPPTYEVQRDIPGYSEWRRLVYRNNHLGCRACGIFQDSNAKMHAHHIENYGDNKDLRTDPSNGILLCKRCHFSFHNKYGHKNTNREQLKKWIEVRILETLNELQTQWSITDNPVSKEDRKNLIKLGARYDFFDKCWRLPPKDDNG